jgi:putative FmdB family regulatory protein
MPIYEIRCMDCGSQWEDLLEIGAPLGMCICGGYPAKLISAPNFRVNNDGETFVKTLDGRSITAAQAKAEGLAPRENGESQKSLYDRFREKDPIDAVRELGAFVPNEPGEKPTDGKWSPAAHLGYGKVTGFSPDPLVVKS